MESKALEVDPVSTRFAEFGWIREQNVGKRRSKPRGQRVDIGVQCLWHVAEAEVLASILSEMEFLVHQLIREGGSKEEAELCQVDSATDHHRQ